VKSQHHERKRATQRRIRARSFVFTARVIGASKHCMAFVASVVHHNVTISLLTCQWGHPRLQLDRRLGTATWRSPATSSGRWPLSLAHLCAPNQAAPQHAHNVSGMLQFKHRELDLRKKEIRLPRLEKDPIVAAPIRVVIRHVTLDETLE
jgi:hypothetical protein